MLRFLRRFRRRDDPDEVAPEINAHLAIEQAEQHDRGNSAEDAARLARLIFGNTMQVQEDIHEPCAWGDVERVAQDVRFGARLLMRSHVWTTVVGLTLALGVGISTAVCSVIYGVLLAPLPYAAPDLVSPKSV